MQIDRNRKRRAASPRIFLPGSRFAAPVPCPGAVRGMPQSGPGERGVWTAQIIQHELDHCEGITI